jgi:transcription termination factor Rho
LLDADVMQKVWAIRNAMQGMEEVEGLRFLYKKMLNTKNNQDFLSIMNNGA